MVAWQDAFGETYFEAREQFLKAASPLGKITSYLCNVAGPKGEPLYADVLEAGDRAAPKVLFLICGTHGLEGTTGSAAITGWLLAGGMKTIPAGVRVVILHGVNPWGFAHQSRTTENNVDLNRNFIDHTQAYPENPLYDELYQRVRIRDWSDATEQGAEDAMMDFLKKYGQATMVDVMARGQYTHPDGAFFGGDHREWPNQLLERVVKTHVLGAEKVSVVEWHTGLGEPAEDFFICMNEKGDPLFDLACDWFGREKIDRENAFEGGPRPKYTGLLHNGVREHLGDTPMAFTVVEFGTKSRPEVRTALRIDLWLKFEAKPDSNLAPALRARMVDAFCPADPAWRQVVVDKGTEIHTKALAGLNAWN